VDVEPWVSDGATVRKVAALYRPVKALLAVLAVVILSVGLFIAIFEIPARLPRNGQALVLLVGGLFAAAFILIASVDTE
jgi:hypothetical protein